MRRRSITSTISDRAGEIVRLVLRSRRMIIFLIICLLIFSQFSTVYEVFEAKTNSPSGSSQGPDLKGESAGVEEAKESVNVVTVTNENANRNYIALLNRYGDDFANAPFDRKCQMYFEELYNANESWALHTYEKDTKKFNKHILESKTKWVDKELEKLNESRKKEHREKHEDSSEEPESFVGHYDRLRFESVWHKEQEQMIDVQYSIINEIKHLRTFSKCYLDNTDGFSKLQALDPAGKYENLEEKVLPYLSRKYPVYVRWTGERVVGPPEMGKYDSPEMVELDNNLDINSLDAKLFVIPQEGFDHSYDVGRSKSFLAEFRSRINGKGIIMSSSNGFLEDTARLIRTLRAVGNKLPIQITHKGDLTSSAQMRLIKEARGESVYYPEEDYAQQMKDPHLDFDSLLPKQEIWFVNVERAISDEYKESFVSYSNKLLAYLFNSYDEMLLVDSDIVPYVNPQRFFETSQYIKSNSLFYKDRSHDETVSEEDTQFFKDMMPARLDEVVFNISRATNRTFNNRYMKLRFKHFMESGVVALKRSEYWDGIMVAVQLSFLEPVKTRVWGDKELFWLGLSIAGTEQYEFNDYYVASIGQLTNEKFRKDVKAKELCATHPGHISSDNQSLMWINSGVMTCKRFEAAKDDFEEMKKIYGFDSEEEVSKFYRSPLKITDAIIPPDSGLYKVKNDQGEPEQGWKTSGLCTGYFWCAYSSVGNGSLPEYQGSHIRFSDADVQWHDYIGSVYRGKVED